MVSGVPVISSNTGGLPEVNLNGSSGYLSPVSDIKDINDGCLNILKDPKILFKVWKALKLWLQSFMFIKSFQL